MTILHSTLKYGVTSHAVTGPCPLAQALGLRFKALSISEANENYRKVIMENHSGSVVQMFDDINAQVADWNPESKSPDIAITGSPCNPFSSQRSKRYVEGNVAAHCSYETTMTSVVDFYETIEPKLGITEQVSGFDKSMSAGSDHTPMQLLPGTQTQRPAHVSFQSRSLTSYISSDRIIISRSSLVISHHQSLMPQNSVQLLAANL